MFERQFGARKFGACVVFLHVLATLVQVAALAVGRSVSPSQWAFSSDPYALLFGLLSVFFFDISQSAPFTLFGLPLSDHLFVSIADLLFVRSFTFLSETPTQCTCHSRTR